MTNPRTPGRPARRLIISAALAVTLAAGSAGPATAISPASQPQPTASQAKPKRLHWLFVQAGSNGTWQQTGDSTYELTLSGVGPRLLAFTDRPGRKVAQPLVPDLLPALGIEGDDPPNAALVAVSGGKDRSVVVELTGYSYDRTARTITYSVRTIDDPEQRRITAQNTGAAKADTAMPATFTQPVLLIDFMGCNPIGMQPGSPMYAPGWPTCVTSTPWLSGT